MTTLPENAKRVFKGVIFDVYQWEQTMFDGSTKTFEKVKRPDTVEIIATVGDKMLIEEQQQPDSKTTWINLPSGRADHSDDMRAEAQRELLEETGYHSDDWQLWKTVSQPHKVIHAVHYFIARNCRRERGQELDAGERINIRLISFDEFLLLSDEPNFWAGPELIIHLLRCRLDPSVRKKFYQTLFPQ